MAAVRAATALTWVMVSPLSSVTDFSPFRFATSLLLPSMLTTVCQEGVRQRKDESSRWHCAAHHPPHSVLPLLYQVATIPCVGFDQAAPPAILAFPGGGGGRIVLVMTTTPQGDGCLLGALQASVTEVPFCCCTYFAPHPNWVHSAAGPSFWGGGLGS